MKLSDNQNERLNNITSIQYAAGILGNIGGIIYAKKTGGGFWRYVGYAILGGLIVGIPTALVATPFKNKILEEGDKSESNSSKSNSGNPISKETEVIKVGQHEFNDLLNEAINAERRVGKSNQFSQLKGDPSIRKKYVDNFKKSVTNDEWKALMNFYQNYNKSLTDTFDKIGAEQKKLVQIGTAKVFGYTG